MRNFISRSVLVVALLAAVAAPSAALAKWVVETNPFGGYDVTDGHGTVHTNGRRTANKVARILNRATNGFVDPGSGPCHDPAPGTQC
jgi:hypothetical protein